MWIILKVFIEFVINTILLLLYVIIYLFFFLVLKHVGA